MDIHQLQEKINTEQRHPDDELWIGTPADNSICIDGIVNLKQARLVVEYLLQLENGG